MKKILLLLTLLISGIGVSQTQPTVLNATFDNVATNNTGSTCTCAGWINKDIADQAESSTLSSSDVVKFDDYESDGIYQEIAVETNSDYTLDLEYTYKLSSTTTEYIEVIILKGSTYAPMYVPAYDADLTTAPETGYGYSTVASVELAANQLIKTTIAPPGNTSTQSMSTLTFNTGSEVSIAIFIRAIDTDSMVTHGDPAKDKGWMNGSSEIRLDNLSLINTSVAVDPSVIKTHSIGSSTSSSSTRGPIQRGSAASSTALYSRNNLVYTSTELLADLTSNALISSIDFDLGSTNIITASGDATLDIYMKNSTITEAPATEDWTNIISGATLVGSYTFNTTNNFPGAEGFLTFNLDTDFEYTGGTLEVSVDWNSGGLTVADADQPALYFSGDGSLNWHYSATAHNSVVNKSGTASAPTTLNSQKAERVNTRFTFKEMTTSTWVGTTPDWGTGSNWSSGFVPSEAVTVTIGSTSNDPVISSSTGANTRDLTLTSAGLTIESGGSLIVGGTPSGDITYNRTLGTTNWYLVSSPVSGETMTDMRSNNAFGTGSGSNIGFAPYTTADDSWSYFTTSSTDALANGTGYSAKLNASGDISFTGTINTADVNASVSFLGNGFNLVGNPYTAYINSKTFLDANSNLDQTQLWVWNQASGMYEVKTNASAFILAPTQGFFVKANSGTQVTFGQTNQVNTGGTFQKSATTEVKLLMTDGESNRFAKIYYLDNTTKGFDTGYEGEVFGGIKNSLDVFSQLVEDNQGKNYQVQSLPVSEMESTIVPLGLTATANKEITFSVETLNLPEGIKVFLEDRKMNVFTNLNDGNYKVTLSEATNGVGRFYLHTSSKSALSVDDNLALDNISIFKTNATTLRIVGLQQGNTSVKLFNILGKQVMNSSFEANGVKDIALPNLATGVYIVKLEAEAGNLNKKIILE